MTNLRSTKNGEIEKPRARCRDTTFFDGDTDSSCSDNEFCQDRGVSSAISSSGTSNISSAEHALPHPSIGKTSSDSFRLLSCFIRRKTEDGERTYKEMRKGEYYSRRIYIDILLR